MQVLNQTNSISSTQITISLVGEMGLGKVKEISTLLFQLEGTQFVRRTYTWFTPLSNLEEVVKLSKELPITAHY